jgi:hypothetical protein
MVVVTIMMVSMMMTTIMMTTIMMTAMMMTTGGDAEGPAGPTISRREAQLIRYGCRNLALRALKENQARRLGHEELKHIRQSVEFMEREVRPDPDKIKIYSNNGNK